VAGTLLAYTDF